MFPTDQIYLDYGGKRGLSVLAPGAGVVFALRDQFGGDFELEIRVDETVSYSLAHLFPEPGLRVGSRVRAG